MMQQHPEITWMEATGYPSWLQPRDQDRALQRINVLTERLLERIDQAVEEQDRETLVTKTKEKTDTGERTTEEHTQVKGLVDVKRVKDLSSALKTLRDIRMPMTPLDLREQEIRIRSLEARLTQQSGQDILVTMSEQLEEFAG